MRSTKVNIYLKNLLHNFREIKNQCNNVFICAAVKANAYGHGALKVAQTLETNGCNYFGVATTIEAEELINGGISKPIILLSLVTPDEIESLIKLEIEPVVTTIEYIKLIEEKAVLLNRQLNLHLKVDTGMGRIGCSPKDALTIAKYIKNSNYLNLKGLCTHLSTSDSLNQDYTNLQLKTFRDVVKTLKKSNIEPVYTHTANSGAITLNSDAIFNMVRPGIILYGYPPNPDINGKINLKPVLELETKVVDLKLVEKGRSISYGRTYTTKSDEYIATIPIGYADGYFRSLSNKGIVSINGKLFPVVGRVCMDQLMIKVDSTVKLYDKVILIKADTSIPNAESIAKQIDTICYEVLTNIHRVKKYYIF